MRLALSAQACGKNNKQKSGLRCTDLFRNAKGGVYQTFKIAEQKPNFIAKNKPEAAQQNDRKNNQQKNFGFTHHANHYSTAPGAMIVAK